MPDIIYFLLGVLGLLLIYFIISYRLYITLFFKFKYKPVKLVDEEDPFYVDTYKWYEDIPKDDVYITSYDKLSLHGVFIPSHDKKSTKLAIVIHGYQSKAQDMAIIAKMYSDLGFKVLVIDQRGHGLSHGKFTSMGYYEAYDLKKWLHYATRNYGAKINILLHGVSMGAATAIMVTKFRESKQVKTLILDSCFTNFRDSLKLSVKNPILRIFLPGLSLMSYLFLKFFLKDVNPQKMIKNICIPTLFIYGAKDKVITKEMTDQLYEDIKTKDKELLVIDDARHAKGFEVNKNAYIKQVIKITNEVFNIRKGDIKYCK
ncbi:MAG: alpha/beta hydrolase [Tenericutes bacterium]|jgi:alpha-beta hydrolase superfamily lysophospholipase|nr:alpha/beta hydrolase [Mycoplasmatota bacterium]